MTPPSTIDKRALVKCLRTKLDTDLHKLVASQKTVQAGATHAETRQEDPKDTRAIEAGYLARGLAERVELMRDAVAMFSQLEVVDYGPDDPIGVTALVALESESDGESIYLLVPCAAGETLEHGGATIRTVTPGSPLGQALIGKRVDDEVELDLPGKRLVATVTWTR